MIRDEIRGNVYANLTYGFQMFKPPSWDLIPEARKALPDAIAALGTYDQTTLLVIGREHTKIPWNRTLLPRPKRSAASTKITA